MFNRLSRRHFAGLQDGRLLDYEPNPLKSARARDGQPHPEPPRLFRTTFSGERRHRLIRSKAPSTTKRGIRFGNRYAHTPGKILDRGPCDIADDHYHRYKRGRSINQGAGNKGLWFSIAWPRVFPEGTGSPNPKGLDFYNRLVDELLANGIEPFATLYHWDLPQSAFQDRVGGWMSRDTSKAFADYAGFIAERLSNRVKHIFTINECYRLAYFGYGMERPKPQALPARAEPGFSQCRAGARSGSAGGASAWASRVSPAENIVVCIPAIETPANIRAIATRELNASYLTGVLEGKYTDGSGLCRKKSEKIHR